MTPPKPALSQPLSSAAVSPLMARTLYEKMLLIRKFEEKVAEKVADKMASNEIKTPCHLYIGQEAIATGVCANLNPDDYIFGTHRSHGHYLAKGGDVNALMAEIYCRRTGCSKGRGGSMHLAAPEIGILGTTPIVAASIPLAVGTALASHIRKDKRVTVAFFGDGATEEGSFHEALNFASLHKLPIVFVCENNFYSSHLELHDRQPADNIYLRAEGHSMLGKRHDGNNVVETFETSRAAIEHARLGKGPTLLEYQTYRWRGHVGANLDLEMGIRNKETLEKWMERCPIKYFKEYIFEHDLLSEDELQRLHEDVTRRIEEAYCYAIESPLTDPKEHLSHVYRQT